MFLTQTKMVKLKKKIIEIGAIIKALELEVQNDSSRKKSKR